MGTLVVPLINQFLYPLKIKIAFFYDDKQDFLFAIKAPHISGKIKFLCRIQ